jgi:hypothetical protein
MTDTTGEAALAPAARPAWNVFLLVGAIVSGLAAFLTADRYLAVSAAHDVVLPVEKRLDDHLSQSKALREMMQQWVQEQRSQNRTVSKKLDALCRASPAANCPLGVDE